MKIRTTDIPAEGRELSFEVDTLSLNERVAASCLHDPESIQPPTYVFLAPTRANLSLHLEGATVVVSGHAESRFVTQCSRCAEDTTKELSLPVDIVLKPRTARGPLGAHDEDLHFGFYDGQEVDCSDIVEEFLILALPFSVSCSDECRGLCPKCGVNLNVESCQCKPDKPEDSGLGILRGLKISQN